MLNIGFPIPKKENEKRRALVPGDMAKILYSNHLVIEKGYGDILGYQDRDYTRNGATCTDRKTVCECPVICNPKPVLQDEYFTNNKILFGWMHAVQNCLLTERLMENNITAIAWEDMFENRKHCFWQNNELAGEAAVVHSFLLWGKRPHNCHIAILGCGNVARGVIRYLKNIGSDYTLFNRKTSHRLRKEINRYDVIINAVKWDLFRKDRLVYAQDLQKMKPGSLIIDITCDKHMSIETSHPTSIDKPIYVHQGITHYAVDHTPALYYKTASEYISHIVSNYLDELILQRHNPVLHNATIINHGRIQNQDISRFQKRSLHHVSV